jgi:hypothetical protein
MRRIATAVTAAFVLTTLPAAAQVIVSPVDGVINAGGPGFGLLSHTYDQSGLSVGFTSGVTNFDAYIALNPMHTNLFPGYEWFSNSGTTSASVTYDLGSTMTIDRLALWNEESSGIGLLDLFWSVNGTDFFALALGIAPFDNPLADYPAQVFGFNATNFRFVRFDMSECPQPDPGSFPSCAIGEVAFSARLEQQVVPEPITLLLLGSGLVGVAAVRRRRRDEDLG